MASSTPLYDDAREKAPRRRRRHLGIPALLLGRSFDLVLGLLTELEGFGLNWHVVAEPLVPVLVDAAAGVAAGGALLGVRELDVRVYGLDHRLLVGGEGGAGLDVPTGDALVSHPAEPRAAIGV